MKLNAINIAGPKYNEPIADTEVQTKSTLTLKRRYHPPPAALPLPPPSPPVISQKIYLLERGLSSSFKELLILS